MSWTQDYCTVCDKQCPSGSMYCSQECLSSESSARSSVASEGSGRNSSEPNISGSASEASRASGATAPTTLPAAQYLLARQEEKFLYDSPLLKPQQNSLSVSPPLSPLLIAQGASETNLGASVGRLSQSSSSYRRWLQADN